jgi:D-arginine dehydrogenase
MEADVLVVGGGIAGLSLGYFLSREGKRVLILERETRVAYHATGRSALFYRASHGPLPVQRLALLSRRFFLSPPEEFGKEPLLTPRGALFVAKRGEEGLLEEFVGSLLPESGPIFRLELEKAKELLPALRPDYGRDFAYEPQASDIRLEPLLAGFVRGIEAQGGAIHCCLSIRQVRREEEQWVLETDRGPYRGEILCNACGAWVDEFARRCGACPIGIQPLRRTVCQVALRGVPVEGWPAFFDVAERFYCKPLGELLLVSPADAVPSEPGEVQADIVDCQEAMQRLGAALELPPWELTGRWAGLRSFVSDGLPVVGADPMLPGFFWQAALGGYGIETSPALGKLGASLCLGKPLSSEYLEVGLSKETFLPGRESLRSRK